MPALADAQKILRPVFGFAEFRAGQSEIIETILAGRDVLAMMPICRRLHGKEQSMETAVANMEMVGANGKRRWANVCRPVGHGFEEAARADIKKSELFQKMK